IRDPVDKAPQAITQPGGPSTDRLCFRVLRQRQREPFGTEPDPGDEIAVADRPGHVALGGTHVQTGEAAVAVAILRHGGGRWPPGGRPIVGVASPTPVWKPTQIPCPLPAPTGESDRPGAWGGRIWACRRSPGGPA